MKPLTDKNIVITGAAAGIGRLMALYFAKEGSNIAIVDINDDALSKTEHEISALGVKAKAYRCDVSNREEIETSAEQIKKDFGSIDILVNNAGIAPGGWTYDAEYEQIKKTLDINLLGLIWMTRQFLPEMIERNSGHIVNISSAMGLQAVPRMSDYVATKFGVVGYSDTLRLEMKKHGYTGVKVTIACPSGIDTGMFEGYKPPLLSPLLKPETVAKQIVRAVKKDKPYLRMPFIVKTIPFLKGLPTGLIDKIGELLGLYKSMDHLRR
ncbi:MAG: SDR family oxidoreductase [Deltaproteobacteria bacterium]|nr:SDR family oxidoreductase [Deltaproteobacteria bacterium]